MNHNDNMVYREIVNRQISPLTVKIGNSLLLGVSYLKANIPVRFCTFLLVLVLDTSYVYQWNYKEKIKFWVVASVRYLSVPALNLKDEK